MFIKGDHVRARNFATRIYYNDGTSAPVDRKFIVRQVSDVLIYLVDDIGRQASTQPTGLEKC